MSSGETRNSGVPANNISEESPPSLAKGPWAPSFIPLLPSTFHVAAHLAGESTGPPGKCQAVRRPSPFLPVPLSYVCHNFFLYIIIPAYFLARHSNQTMSDVRRPTVVKSERRPSSRDVTWCDSFDDVMTWLHGLTPRGRLAWYGSVMKVETSRQPTGNRRNGGTAGLRWRFTLSY